MISSLFPQLSELSKENSTNNNSSSRSCNGSRSSSSIQKTTTYTLLIRNICLAKEVQLIIVILIKAVKKVMLANNHTLNVANVRLRCDSNFFILLKTHIRVILVKILTIRIGFPWRHLSINLHKRSAQEDQLFVMFLCTIFFAPHWCTDSL